jgi:hypothetical protein
VAPVLDPGARRRTLRLPAGTWVDFWRSGGLTPRRARLLSGPRTVTVPAPIGQPPILARGGTLLPLLPAGVDSLSRHAGAPGGTVGLAERAAGASCWPGRAAGPRPRSVPRGGPSRARTRAAGGLRSARSTVRRVTVRASLDALRRPFKPCALRGAVEAATVPGGVRATLVLRDGQATLRALRRCRPRWVTHVTQAAGAARTREYGAGV